MISGVSKNYSDWERPGRPCHCFSAGELPLERSRICFYFIYFDRACQLIPDRPECARAGDGLRHVPRNVLEAGRKGKETGRQEENSSRRALIENRFPGEMPGETDRFQRKKMRRSTWTRLLLHIFYLV